MRRAPWSELGTVVRVPVSAESFVYAVVLRTPFIRFYGPERQDELADIATLATAPVLFEVVAHDLPIRRKAWPTVGRIRVDPDYRPTQFRQNKNGCKIVDGDGERPATIAECIGSERAAVWAQEHVEERLRDWAAGRPNALLAYLRLRMPSDPPFPFP